MGVGQEVSGFDVSLELDGGRGLCLSVQFVLKLFRTRLSSWNHIVVSQRPLRESRNTRASEISLSIFLLPLLTSLMSRWVLQQMSA